MKNKIIIAVGIITILAVGYNSYILYQVKKVTELNNTALGYLFTPDAQGITGFTQEVFKAGQVIQQAQQTQPVKK